MIRTVDIGQLMHIAQFFRPLDLFLRFLPGQSSRFAHADAGFGVVAEVDAPFAFEVCRAFTDHSSQLAAFTRCDTDGITGLVQPVADFLVTDLPGVVGDCAFNRDRSHQS